MKVLIAYDSVSTQRLTEKIAEVIAQTLKDAGLEVDSVLVKDAGAEAVKVHDCLIVGSPTMAWKPTPETMKFLNGLPDNGFSGKSAAAFDTQIRSVISGNATKVLEERLKELGFAIPTPALLSYVAGRTREMHLKDGELERAKSWAEAFAKAVQVKP